MPTPTGRQQVIADAAITVIAEGGIRSLTHRAVDSAAVLPIGTTSHHYRTRRDLLRATLSRLSAAEVVQLRGAQFAPLTTLLRTRSDRIAEAGRIAERASVIVEAQLTTYRHATLARYALQLEVATDPELREILLRGYQFEQLATDNARRLGARRPKRAGRYLVAFIEGLTYHHLVGPGSEPGDGRAVDRESIKLGLLAYLVGLIPGDE